MDVLANIDPTSSNSAAADPFRPSFFELIAQEQLSQLLKPAIRYVLTVLAQRHPRYLLRIVNRFDEIYSLLMLAVERHYLYTWSMYSVKLTTRCLLYRALLRPAASTSSGRVHQACGSLGPPTEATGRASTASARDLCVSSLFGRPPLCECQTPRVLGVCGGRRTHRRGRTLWGRAARSTTDAARTDCGTGAPRKMEHEVPSLISVCASGASVVDAELQYQLLVWPHILLEALA